MRVHDAGGRSGISGGPITLTNRGQHPSPQLPSDYFDAWLVCPTLETLSEFTERVEAEDAPLRARAVELETQSRLHRERQERYLQFLIDWYGGPHQRLDVPPPSPDILARVIGPSLLSDVREPGNWILA